ncbi:hypothetical protein BC936DRAFT_148238, partial [Jimgerdemannia flammicorona]
MDNPNPRRLTRTKSIKILSDTPEPKPSKRKRAPLKEPPAVAETSSAAAPAPQKRKRVVEPMKETLVKETAKTTKGKSKGKSKGKGKGKEKSVKDKDTKEVPEKPEKRLKKFRTSCPLAVRDRINRARTQRMFMVKRTILSPTSQEFAVLGSTGNIYTVKIAHVPSCDCPDAAKGNHCKHILLVMLKVLRVGQNSPMLYQAAYLTSELLEIFENAAPDPTVVANAKVQTQYEALKRGEQLPEEKQERRPLDTSDCPICFEAFEEADIKKILFCHVCLNNIHIVS